MGNPIFFDHLYSVIYGLSYDFPDCYLAHANLL